MGGLALLGLSLSIKHVLIFFPLWLAMRPQSLWRRFLCLIIPYGIFVLSFLPYWHDWPQIRHQVVEYRSFANGLFWNLYLGDVLNGVPLILPFAGAMLVAGWCARKVPVLDAFWMYLCCLLIFSSAHANQYWVIPVAAIAARPTVWGISYFVLVTLFLCGSNEGLAIHWLAPFWWGKQHLLFLMLMLQTAVVVHHFGNEKYPQ